MDTTTIALHDREIHENARLWEKKPLLREIYSGFYAQITRRIDRSIPGEILEIGSGIGNLKMHLADCVTSDLFQNPWLDRIENAYALSCADSSVSHLVLFDVWHHLEFPGTALREFHRVLRRGGRVILFEPAMGLLGRIVFGLFHHEPLGLGRPIEWEAPADFSADKACYFAAQASASRIFVRGEHADKFAAWNVREVGQFPGLAYLGSGGFRGPQLYPRAMLPFLQWLDRLLVKMPRLFAARMLVLLEKK
jgi:SAM-dependent methyltransferase